MERRGYVPMENGSKVVSLFAAFALIGGASWYLYESMQSMDFNKSSQSSKISTEEDLKKLKPEAETADAEEIPMTATAYYSAGWAQQSKGNDDEALRIYSRAEALAKAENQMKILEDIYMNCGAIYLKQKNHPFALLAFQLALKTNPSLAAAEYQVKKLTEPLEEESVYEKEIERAPSKIRKTHAKKNCPKGAFIMCDAS
jgi:tetratricopeptide (TPR) repeat protein